MAEYTYKQLGIPLDLNNWESLNDNFKTIARDLNNLSGDVLASVIDGARLTWQEPVNTFADLATTYPTAQEGWAVFVRNSGVNGETYRYDGSSWLKIQDFDATAINEVDTRLTSQLAETETHLTNAVNVIDETANINSELTNVQNSKRVALNTSKTLSTAVPNIKDKYFIGNGEVVKQSVASRVQNFFVDVKPEFRTFAGKANKFDSYAALKRFTDQAKLGTAKVAFIGDSITTTGGNSTTISYNDTTPGNMYSYSPNGLTEVDSYFFRILEMLTTSFKETTFEVKNYAIAGSYIQQHEDQKTFSGVTKKWIDFPKDEAPDILFVNWGMNQASFDLARSCKFWMTKLIDYVRTWPNPPLIVVSTAPRPVMEMTDQAYGQFGAQFARHIASHAFRHVAIEKGCYVLDLNYLYTVLKDGVDFERLHMVSEAPVFGGTVSQNPDTTFTLPNAGQLNINNGVKDFILEFNMVFTDASTLATGEYLDVYINQAVSESNQQILSTRTFIYPNATGGVTRVRNFGNIADPANYSAFTQDKTTARTNTIAVRIEKRNAEFNIYINKVRVIHEHLTCCDVAGFIQLRSIITNPFTISGVKFYKAKYTQYTPIMTDSEAWGSYSSSNFTTRQDIGGNGVNHPSNILLKEVYEEALKEMAHDLKVARM